MCWFQGSNHWLMGNFMRLCIYRWKTLNPDWKVIVLCDETISNYVPEYFRIINNSPDRRIQHKSDLLRLLLLSKYGGVWADGSLFPMKPLSSFYNKIVNKTGFFSYRFLPRHRRRETVVWFLCSKFPNNYLIKKWKNKFVKKFKEKAKFGYYEMAFTLSELYDTDKKVKSIIDNMVQISEKLPHSAMKSWKKRKKTYMYKRPNRDELVKDLYSKKEFKKIIKKYKEFYQDKDK